MSKPYGDGPAEQPCAPTPVLHTPLDADTAADVAVKLKALSDPVRLRLFSAVAGHDGGEACVCDISAGVDVTQPTVSHHLKVLREAGLLTSERRASWVYYAVVPDALLPLSTLFRAITAADALAGSRP